MDRTALMLSARNLLLLVVVALPLAILSGWLLWLAFPVHASGAEEVRGLEAPLAVYALAIGPTLLGGGLHQLLILNLPLAWTGARRRRVARLTTLLIPAVMLALGGYILAEPRVAAATALGLLAYGTGLRLPDDRGS